MYATRDGKGETVEDAGIPPPEEALADRKSLWSSGFSEGAFGCEGPGGVLYSPKGEEE